MTATDRLRRNFGLIAFGVLAAALGILWLSADALIGAVRPAVEGLAGPLGLVTKITPNADHGWTVWTSLLIRTGSADQIGRAAGFVVDANHLRYLLRSFPLFIALIIAPPYDRKRDPQLRRR